MKYISLIFLSLFYFYTALGQKETIISDGSYGIYNEFITDTLVVTGFKEDSPSLKAGLSRGDKIIFINGRKVSGVGITEQEMYSHFLARAGSIINLKILRAGTDSLISIRLQLDFSREINTEYCYYDYCVKDNIGLKPGKIRIDSSGIVFMSMIEKALEVYSVKQDSNKGVLDIRPGDKILSFNHGIYSWTKTKFNEYDDRDTTLRILRDSSEFLIHKDIRNYPELKITSVFDHDLEGQTIWLRLFIEKRLTEDKTVLMRFDEPYDSIFLYQRLEDGPFTEKKTGTQISKNNRDPFYKSNPVIRLNLRKDKADTVYVKMFNSQGLNYAPGIDILSLDYTTKFEYSERLILGALLGMLMIISIYYLILYLLLKDKSYLVYLLFIISLSFTLFQLSGYGPQFIWPDYIGFFNSIDVLFTTVPFTLFLIFSSSYLNLDNSFKIWNRIGRIVLIVLWLMSIFNLAETLGNKTGLWTSFQSFFNSIYTLSLIIPGGMIFSAMVIRIRQRYKPALGFLLATSVLIISIIIYSNSNTLSGFLINHFDISPDISTMFLKASIYIGAIIQFLIFSLGLGQKMRDSEREIKEAQAKTIEQLKENERLKDLVNIELEQKVRERTMEIELQKNELQEQKQDITDSINYAKRIQSAVLPSEENLREVLPEHFVFYRPRDIVSGDFYWMRRIKNYTIVAAADCTGHGVPGAFMSMLGISLLNEQVIRSKFDNSGEILNRLRKKIKETLKQEGKDREAKDGMDIALAIINNESLELQFSGAFNPLYIVRKKPLRMIPCGSDFTIYESENYSLFEVRGDRQPIGIHFSELDFKTNTFQLLRDDTLYLFSDGFSDQIGGLQNKKFLSKRLKMLILEIQNNELQVQKEILEKTLVEWQGKNQQVDDILIFGIKI